ncbi:MAG TPA: L-aspartate oxidase [Granulicella sp.]
MYVVDFLVIGGGIAGLSAVLRLSRHGSVLLISKDALDESNTAYAQGGIAVAMGGEEDIALHFEDTLAAGDGLVDRAAAALLVEQGPRRVQELLDWGTAFDREHGHLMLTREGAHSRDRILHANGDATGREIATSLLRRARTLEHVTLLEWTIGVDLLIEDGRVVGATLLDAENQLQTVYARATLLASGGAGQVYSDTTNPPVATGDGIAMAYRAGAALADMEFYQFHPTAFALPGAPRFLMSEALRGEGAYLVNASGKRFMEHYHPLLELAPRDVVARAITQESLEGEVYLDMRHVTKDLAARFPGISAFLATYNLNLNHDLIPVRPAAHYLMGGIRTDLEARTTLPGLYAAGEVACTGVHGANRLASNSLLEGLVFGAQAADAMLAEMVHFDETGREEISQTSAEPPLSGEETAAWVAELRALMWRDAGLLRDGEGLFRAEESLAELAGRQPQGLSRSSIEARNLFAVAGVIVASALAREESRGAHYRRDFPQKAPVARHSVVENGRVSFTEGAEL